jgi:hypothetical protein
MSIKELLKQMDDFFDLSKKKQSKKREKLTALIETLEEKKAKLKRKMRREARKDKNSKKVYNLCKEFKVITRMIKKAKKHEALISRKNCC